MKFVWVGNNLLVLVFLVFVWNGKAFSTYWHLRVVGLINFIEKHLGGLLEEVVAKNLILAILHHEYFIIN